MNVEAVQALRASGLSIQDIASSTGYSERAIRAALRRPPVSPELAVYEEARRRRRAS